MIDLSVIDKYMGFAGVAIDEYVIGRAEEGKACLLQGSDGSWEVFDLRNGQKVGVQVFESNELACYQLFGVLAERHITAGRLIPVKKAKRP